MTQAPRGSMANVRAFNIPRVCGVSGNRQAMISHCPRNATISLSPAKLFTPGTDFRVRLQPDTAKSNIAKRSAVTLPISPNPNMPTRVCALGRGSIICRHSFFF